MLDYFATHYFPADKQAALIQRYYRELNHTLETFTRWQKNRVVELDGKTYIVTGFEPTFVSVTKSEQVVLKGNAWLALQDNPQETLAVPGWSADMGCQLF